MEEMRTKIKKTFYNPPTVCFPLFISEKNFFFSPNPKPLFKLAFCSFLTCCRNFCMTPPWGSRWWLLSVSEKKNYFFLNTLRIDVFKTKKRIRNGWLEKKFFKFNLTCFALKNNNPNFSKRHLPFLRIKRKCFTFHIFSFSWKNSK